jgi:hypothetical protein
MQSVTEMSEFLNDPVDPVFKFIQSPPIFPDDFPALIIVQWIRIEPPAIGGVSSCISWQFYFLSFSSFLVICII